MRNKNKKIGLLITACLIFPAAALAVPVQIDYAFEVTNLFAGFPANTSIVGRAVYDTDSVSINPPNFFPLLSSEVIVNGVAHSSGPNHTVNDFAIIEFINDSPSDPPVDIVLVGSSFDFDLLPGLNIQAIGLQFIGPANLLDADAVTVINPADWPPGVGSVGFSNAQCPAVTCGATGQLTSVTFTPLRAVAEPGTFALLASGMIAMVLMRRRRVASALES